MCAQLLTIKRKIRPIPLAFANVDGDFDYQTDDTVDSSIVLQNPQWSVYCLDDVRQRVIFAEMPPHVDLSAVPLVFASQYDHVVRLLAVPYDEAIALANDITKPENIIFIFHSSRCGSTLLSRAFNEIPHVSSFSEPDYFSQMEGLREPNGSRDSELATILRACTLLACRPTQHKPDTTVYAFKPRGAVQVVGGLFRQAIPDSVNLLIYRNATDTLNSWLGALPRLGAKADDLFPAGEEDYSYKFWKQYGGTGNFTMYDWCILHWLISLDAHLSLDRNGMPFLAVRYEDLNVQRERVLGAILDYCQLSQEHIADMLRAFDHDAQAGTIIARENPHEGNRYAMTDAERERLLSTLQRHPVINTPDYTAPGTLKLP